MSKITLLDCTLRDGGYVNDWKFGRENMLRITSGLNKAGVDHIEIGFLVDEKFNIDRSKFESVDQAEKLIPKSSSKSEYVLMIRPDWFSISKLDKSDKIENLRFAFHYKDFDLAIDYADKARNLGYKVFMNPVNITGYSLDEVNKISERLSNFRPSGVSIVDTFGSMQEKDLLDLHDIFDTNLDVSIALGVHLHENLSLTLSLAQKFLQIRDPDRDVIIDSSILGMGRIPGNLPTELIVNVLNNSFDKNYHLDQILSLADDPIKLIKEKLPWGYSPEFAVSAVLKIHRSYPEYIVSDLKYEFSEAFEIMKKIHESGEGEFFSKELVQSFIKSN